MPAQLEVTAITGNAKQIWIATDGAGLVKFDTGSRSFSFVSNPVLDNQSVTSLFLNTDDELWIGLEQSLILKINPTGQIQHFPITPLDKLGADFGNEAQSLFQDSSNNLWIGTEEYGVVVFEPTSGMFDHFKKDPRSILGLSNNAVNSILEDSFGRIWLATNLGVNVYDPKLKKVEKIYLEDGLSSNTIMGLAKDKHGDIWLTTNKGLNRISPQTMTITSYDQDDGLTNEYYGRNAIFSDEESNLYFGGNDGIDIINPGSVAKNLIQPQIAITKLKLFDIEQLVETSSVLTKPIYATQNLTLNYRQNVFSLTFSTLDFTNTDKNQYAYYLQGFDPRWQYVGNQRLAAYTNLPAGKYVFWVKGTNNDGVWSEPRALKIKVTAAPWKSNWAYVIYVLSMIMFVYLILSVKLRQQKAGFELEREREERQRLKERFEMEQRFTANVAHELRTPLTELINMAEVAVLWPDAPELKDSFYQGVLDSANQMHQVVNNLLALARCERGLVKLKFESMNLVEEVQLAWLRHTADWQEKELEFVISGQETWDINSSRTELALILNNIISNAIEYTPKGSQIFLDVRPKESRLKLTNEMDVPLNPEELEYMFQRLWRKDMSRSSAQHSGLGMSLVKAYAEILEISVDVKIEGSDFIIILSNIASIKNQSTLSP